MILIMCHLFGYRIIYFVFIIDDLEEHRHFGELLIVALDMFEITLKQNKSIIDVTKEKYNIVVQMEL